MYKTYPQYNSNYKYGYNNDDRFIGGFAGPFILGGLTGGLLAPYFNRPNYPVVYYPQPNIYYHESYYYPNRPPYPPRQPRNY